MAKTPLFNYVVENYKKMISENDTPHLTGTTTPTTTNPNATPTSDSNPNANKSFDPEKTKKLLGAYQKTAQAAKASNIQTPNPAVAQTPVPGQSPTNPSVDPNAPVEPVLSHDENKKALYDHLVNDLGLTDEAIADIFKK